MSRLIWSRNSLLGVGSELGWAMTTRLQTFALMLWSWDQKARRIWREYRTICYWTCYWKRKRLRQIYWRTKTSVKEQKLVDYYPIVSPGIRLTQALWSFGEELRSSVRSCLTLRSWRSTRKISWDATSVEVMRMGDFYTTVLNPNRVRWWRN